jgi:ribosomal protein S18 acetylase RimI-like enzyme
MTETRVRRATDADARALATVHVESWRQAYAHVFPAERLAALSVDEREVLARQVLADPGRETILVGEVDGAVAGFASTGAARAAGTDTGEVYAIYVAPEYWAQGVGRALMNAALELLVGSGFEEAVLWVLDDNPRARRFYEAGGWRLDGARREGEHLGVHTNEVRYRIDLARQ